MPDETVQVKDLQEQLTRLRVDFDNLSNQFFKNNFTTSQTFAKDAIFTTRLKVPHYSSAPTVGEVGDIIEVGGELFICTTAGTVASPATFTLVGTQS